MATIFKIEITKNDEGELEFSIDHEELDPYEAVYVMAALGYSTSELANGAMDGFDDDEEDGNDDD